VVATPRGAAPIGRGASRLPLSVAGITRARHGWNHNRGFWSFVTATCLAGIMLWTWALSGLSGYLDVLTTPSTLMFVALLLGAELRPLKWLRRQDGGEVTASWSFAAALLLMAPSQVSILAIALASAAADVLHRKDAVRVTFNAAQTSLSLAAGAAILTSSSTQALLMRHERVGPAFLLWVAIAGAVVLVGNSAMTCIVLALHQRVPVLEMTKRNGLRNLSTDGMLLALAPVFVVVEQRSTVLVPLLLLTSYAVHRSVRLALQGQHEATHDALTGLANRRCFDEQVNNALAAAGRRRHALAVMMIDLDGFKEINDRLGHQMGDQLLVAVGDRLQAQARSSDLIARLGGDEFAVLSTGAHDHHGVTEQAERLRRAIAEPFDLGGVAVRVAGSFGIALYPENGTDALTLAEHADAAMYQAKRSGAGVLAYSRLAAKQESGGRQKLMRDLEVAIDDGQLVLHYQPVLEFATDEIVAVEALVRWQHPRLGMVPPGDFIPLAEQTELIEPLSLWVLNQAISDAAAWRRDGHDVGVAVNVSARNVLDLRFPDVVHALLLREGLPAGALDIEITENALNGDPARVRQVLERLRGLGVSVSMDDFGTGYSSLSHLMELRVDTVKIDRSFVIGMADQREAELIVRSVIGLADGLGLSTVAEGVETAEAQRAIAALGCTRMQGYHLSRPLPHDELLSWLHDRRPARRLLEVVR